MIIHFYHEICWPFLTFVFGLSDLLAALYLDRKRSLVRDKSISVAA